MQRNYLNIDIYAENGVLYTRFDTSILVLEFEETEKAKNTLDKIVSLSDLTRVAERFTNEPFTNAEFTNKSAMASKYITKHLLNISPKEFENSFNGELII